MADVVAGSSTDAGIVREQNEDAVATWDEQASLLDPNGRLFALADGMGGHSRGEVASAQALHVLFEQFYSAVATDLAVTLKQGFRAANDRLYAGGAANGVDQMMGTTLVAGVVRGNLLTVANVGDSRAYIVRGGKAQQITRDHSVVAEQVEAGQLTPDQARTSRNRNVITRALGNNPRLDVDIFEVPLLPQDGVVLASDGLYHAVATDELAALAQESSPSEAASQMVSLARERASNDNASAVVVYFGRAVAVSQAAGHDLFDTAPLPRQAPAAIGRAARVLIAAIVVVVLLVLALIALVMSGLLVF